MCAVGRMKTVDNARLGRKEKAIQEVSSGEEGNDAHIQSSETEHALGGIGTSAFC